MCIHNTKIDIHDPVIVSSYGDDWMCCSSCKYLDCEKRFSPVITKNGKKRGKITGCWDWYPAWLPQLSLFEP